MLVGAGLLFGTGFALISVVGEPWHLFVLFGLFIGVGMSTHDVATLSTIARWFVRRRGMMTGIAKVGTATGQMVLPPLAAVLIAGLGWRGAALRSASRRGGCCSSRGVDAAPSAGSRGSAGRPRPRRGAAAALPRFAAAACSGPFARPSSSSFRP